MNPNYPPQGYGQQYPPQSQPPYHPQGHSPYPPQSFGAPPPGPPPGQYSSYPQQGGYGAPPGPQPGHRPTQSFGAPAPPPQAAFGQSQYGPPPGQYGGGPPAQPSLGYVAGQVAPMDMSREADGLRAAMKGFGTDEKALVAILTRLDPLQVAGARQAFTQRHRRDLLNDIEKETSSYFRDGLLGIARGPLEQDVFICKKAIKGLGTKEALLNDVLLARSNADLNAIKARYHQVHGHSLESDVKGDLSLKTERLFNMVLAARRNEESSPVIPQQTDADVAELYRATEGNKVGAEQVAVCAMMTSRSDGQLRAISQAYRQKYHRELIEVLRKNFSGHMQEALLHMLATAEDRAKHDAHQLEAAMKGLGTKDDQLVSRIVRLQADRARMSQARAAYKHFFHKDLAERVRGETRGDYQRLMVACVESA